MNIKLLRWTIVLWCVVCLCFLASAVISQEQVEQEWAIKVTWKALPAVQDIDNYVLSWFDGSRQVWVKVADVDPGSGETVSYITRLAWLKSTLRVGEELCVNVFGQSQGDSGPASPSACGIIVDPAGSSVVVTPPAVPITQVEQPVLEFIVIN